MTNQNEGWDTIEVPSKDEDNKIEFEVESEEEKPIEAVEEQPKEEVVEAAPQEKVQEQPQELDGIKTKGAERRIRQLVRQRKERDEQINALIAQNEELQKSLQSRSTDLAEVTSNSINTNEQNLERTVELARAAYLEAFDSGDKEKALAAQEALAEAKSELKGIQNWKSKIEKQAQQHYERSTHDLSYLWRSSASNGTLIPFMSQVALPGDTWDIDLSTQVMTLPTLGPLFGSYKIQLDLFEIPIRLYQGKLHMNLLNVGMKMEDIKLPLIALNAYATPMLEDNDQVNSSCIFSYLGIRGLGRNYQGGSGDVKRYFNAVPYLGYLDIFKNYYANKQEDKAYFIHKP